MGTLWSSNGLSGWGGWMPAWNDQQSIWWTRLIIDFFWKSIFQIFNNCRSFRWIWSLYMFKGQSKKPTFRSMCSPSPLWTSSPSSPILLSQIEGFHRLPWAWLLLKSLRILILYFESWKWWAKPQKKCDQCHRAIDAVPQCPPDALTSPLGHPGSDIIKFSKIELFSNLWLMISIYHFPL